MRELPNTDRFFGYGETSWENRNTTKNSSGKVLYKDLIHQANTVSLIHIFKHYGISINNQVHRTTCPFKSHKGGREKTPSFNYYPETNTFWCFGCHKGRSVCDFVAEIDGTNETKAAYKVLKLFKNNVGDTDNDSFNAEDEAERLQIMMEFSEAIRDFRQSHLSENDHMFIENICLAYDDIYHQYHSKIRRLDNEALQRINAVLKGKIQTYLTSNNY